MMVFLIPLLLLVYSSELGLPNRFTKWRPQSVYPFIVL